MSCTYNVDGAPYLDIATANMGRALSMLDADPGSPTRGCFDRTYWAWKFTDFPGARFQEGLFLLAFLIDSPLAPKNCHASGRLLQQFEWGLRYWASLQHDDGSFDEAYPYERSYAATAFSCFYIGQAVERVSKHIAKHTLDLAHSTLSRAARWIDKNGEYHSILSNHLSAGAAGLQIVGEMLGTDRFTHGRDRYLATVYREQNLDEGWFREYGGADPGYQTQGLFYLAELFRRTHVPELRDRLVRALNFQTWFAHPDGTFGGEYCSRGTKFGFPAGFEILASEFPSAASIAMHLRTTLCAGRGIGLSEMDSWNLFPMMTSYLIAAENAKLISSAPSLPWMQDGATAAFPAAQLAVARRRNRVLATGIGGALKIWEGIEPTSPLMYEDYGYIQTLRSHTFATRSLGKWTLNQTDKTFLLDTESHFDNVSTLRPTSLMFVLFRLFNLTLGRIPFVSRWLKLRLVKSLILRIRRARGRLNRRVRFEANGRIEISDRIYEAIGELQTADRLFPFHMGSARYVDTVDATGSLIRPPAPRLTPSGATRDVVLETTYKTDK